jgi:NADH:ubiquinone oxidoreductase subunit 2 (subunit N)
MITLSFVLLNKIQGDFRNSLNYFLLQEFLGFAFLIFFIGFLQYIILMIKVGIRPFHFWITSVFLNLDNFILMWFLTFQKFPFLPILLFLFKYLLFFLIILGIFFCYVQIINLKNYKVLVALSSTESFN